MRRLRRYLEAVAGLNCPGWLTLYGKFEAAFQNVSSFDPRMSVPCSSTNNTTNSKRGERTVDARLRLAEELLVFPREHGFPFWVALGAIQRGWCLSMAGREAEGVAQLTGGLAALRSTGTAVPLPYGFTLSVDPSSGVQ